MSTQTKKRDVRLSVKIDLDLKNALTETARHTRLTESTIAREALQEKLANLRRTHPAYTERVEAAVQ